jgi:hypothetical protein
MMMALMQNRNNPSVKMVMGMVTMINKGLTKAFRMANTIATITAE